MNTGQNQTTPNKPAQKDGIDVAIYDSSHPQGLMPGIEKTKALRQALFEMMYRDLMSEADISPKFNGSEMDEEGVYRIKAVDQHSAEFVVDIVERMPPPWPNAQLYVKYQKPKQTVVVEALVPGRMVSTEEIMFKIAQFDHRIRADEWQAMGNRPLGQGNVYTFVIHRNDFDVLNHYDGFIPYNGTRIEFRVLEKPELIPNVL